MNPLAKKPARPRDSSEGEEHLRRVRRICSTLPATTEKLSHGEPTFFVNKKVYTMFANNHHNDGHIAVWLPAAPGLQAALIKSEPRKFFKPPYVGVRGWVGIELDEVDDDELAYHISQAWRLIAPKKLQGRDEELRTPGPTKNVRPTPPHSILVTLRRPAIARSI